ncbi:hypothetical protein [Drosophila suzukii associated ambidensovirus 1]|nr:hypothetical protein [Drosophila suzukii associated ambidensovirus 1]
MLSLRSLALRAVQKTYRHNWEFTQVLPAVLQKELFLMWLHCEETISSDDEDFERVRNRLAPMSLFTRPLSVQTFVDLMSYSNEEIPNFCFEKNHVVFEYFVQSFYGNSRERCLCEFCYVKLGRPFLPYSANLWMEKGWHFKKVLAHQIAYAENILEDVIWKPDYWCEECVKEPLFDIKDTWECSIDTDFHRKRRRYSSSDDDEPVSLGYTEPITGRRMNPIMYKFVSSSR